MAGTAARRKLTTILAADVVGYSRMMAADEEATLATLRAYREVSDALVERHNGRVFSTAGDAFLAEFGSAVEAVRCAIAVQEDLAVRNAELPEDRQMWFRIGVNVGDVMVDGDDLFGDGVNVAARLEGLAEKGGVCISGSTFQQVKNKLSIAFDDIGAQRVKNIPEPIPAFRVVPGRVSVSDADGAAGRLRAARARRLALAGGAAAVLALAGAYAAGLLPAGRAAPSPYDGEWTVTIDNLSGCLDNTPKSYPVTIRDGKIDEPDQRRPKTGVVTAEGEVRIEVADQSGRLLNTQLAKIEGDAGAGRFRGRKESCAGDVAMARRK